MYNAIKGFKQAVLMPLHDYFDALEACNITARFTYIISVVIAFIAAWWIYVPLHELLHAFGCMLGGGEVSRLELSRIYGADLLGKVFPFVSSGSEYAGRLTGFDTHNNDLTYLLTVFLPYLLTVFIGIPMLRSAAGGSPKPVYNCMKFGSALPVAYAPFISITGDYYEIGSILVTKLASLIFYNFQTERWRSDDLIKLVDELIISKDMIRLDDIFGIVLSFFVGVAIIYLTYYAGRLCSKYIYKIGSSPN